MCVVTAVMIGLSMSGGKGDNGSDQESDFGRHEQIADRDSAAGGSGLNATVWQDLLSGIDRDDRAAMAKILADNLYSGVDEESYGLQ